MGGVQDVSEEGKIGSSGVLNGFRGGGEELDSRKCTWD